MTALAAALGYAAASLPVFPILPHTKVPATKHGFYDATTNPATINRYWRAGRNIGIPTGAASGFWALDIDGERGEESLRELEAAHGALPETVAVRTGGGGRHLWWKYTGPIACSTGRVGAGLDVKADRGSVIAPPSIHPNGTLYSWIITYDAAYLATAPDWLIQLARAKPQPTISDRALAMIQPSNSRPGVYGRAALESETAALAAVLPGSRNSALNVAAFKLFQLVAGGELDADQAEAALIEACDRNGLIADDGLRAVQATIRSGSRAGLQHPRSRRGAA